MILSYFLKRKFHCISWYVVNCFEFFIFHEYHSLIIHQTEYFFQDEKNQYPHTWKSVLTKSNLFLSCAFNLCISWMRVVCIPSQINHSLRLSTLNHFHLIRILRVSMIFYDSMISTTYTLEQETSRNIT